MLKTSVVQCDVCGAEYRHGNGWFTVIPCAVSGMAGCIVLPMDGNSQLHGPGVLHCCGQACMMQQVYSLISGQKIEMQEVELNATGQAVDFE